VNITAVNVDTLNIFSYEMLLAMKLEIYLKLKLAFVLKSHKKFFRSIYDAKISNANAENFLEV